MVNGPAGIPEFSPNLYSRITSAITLAGVLLMWVNIFSRDGGDLQVLAVFAIAIAALACYRYYNHYKSQKDLPNYLYLTFFFTCGTLWNITDRYFIHSYDSLWLPALILFVILIGIIAYQNIGIFSKDSDSKFTLAVLIISLFGFSVFSCAFFNCRFDTSAPKSFKCQVVEKYRDEGPRSFFYYVQLSRWGVMQTPRHLRVTHGLYRQVSVGDSVIINERKGLFVAPWFEIEPQ